MGGSASKDKNVYKDLAPKTKVYHKVVDAFPKQQSKVVAITGCTTGTGYHAARAAAKLGAHVVMLNRPSERAEKARAGIASEYPGATITFVSCDLSSFDAVRSAANELKQKFPQGIDVLCLNAGIMACPNGAGPDGFEVQMTTNHFSHFLLAKETYTLLEAAASRNGEARIISHSSMARKVDSNSEPFLAKYYTKNISSLGDDNNAITGGRWKRYHATKLANCVFTYALKEKLAAKGSKVKALVATPGFAATNLQVSTFETGGMPGWAGSLAKYVAQSAEDGACGILECMFNPSAESGDFFRPTSMGEMGGKAQKRKPEKYLYDPNSMQQLWKLSGEAVGHWDI